ncbi:MAG: circularly permuted type 2 ATP-grasp protein, partial [Bacteroidota bacterium]
MTPDTEQKSLFQHYFSDHYSYDELQGDDGNLRPHWKTFFQSFADLGKEEILNRNQDVLRFLKENGVTYNIYGDPAGQNRPWNLDLIPFLISKQEWQTIESGLKQRAELFNHILKDIYSERRLIKNGLLPMDLVFQHSGFLRQCAGITLPGKRNLVVYSADMARSSDGKIWILNDRTQAPSGSGYALENRMAMARMLPELFDGFKVRRLSSYFNSLRNALINMSPVQKHDPRIVILTPGSENETYFEHSYLSSYLGFILAQGDDLMVKDNFVFLKTISGLEKVDVILRRVDDVFCDPLELLEKSQLGVPGLLQAVRSGNVSIANPLGSSILENPGLMPFLQGMSKYFLGEELIMPSIASWWCGQPKELSYVLENLETLVIKRIYRDSKGHTSKDGTALSRAELNELRVAIKAHPHLYVGQEKVSISSTPSLINGKIETRKGIFRSFAVANEDGYNVMTGGLTRTSAEAGNFLVSNQLGGISKDTWIISQDTGNNFSTRREIIPTSTAPQVANSGIITSHIAENLFWVGRYAERVLGNARFQRTVMQFISEGDRRMADSEGITEKLLLEALTKCSYTYPGFTGKDGATKQAQPIKELREILFDPIRIGSLHYNFQMFKNAVYAVRDHWSTDTW